MLVIHCGFVNQNFNFWPWIGEDQHIIEKSGFLGGKITYFIGFFKWSCYYMLTISKYIELEPWGWSQTIKKWSYFLVLTKFLTIFYIYEDFYQFSRIWSLHDSRIFSQINCNLLKYPNFLKIFWQNWNLWYIVCHLRPSPGL